MNERVIKIAYAMAVAILMLIAAVFVAGQGQETAQQNRNSKQSSGQQNRNTNANSKASDNTNTNTNSNSSRSMNGNTNGDTTGTTNSGAGGNMNRSTSGQAGQGMRLGSVDRKFVMEAAMGGMAEVELGRLAAERGSSDAVKQFGQRMVDDHSRANSELMQLASGKGITLPTALDAKHQALVTRMSRLSGAAFDRAYAREMVKDHQKAVALFQREATRGSDSDLKAFAQTTLPALQEHLRMARALPRGNSNDSMNGNMNRSTQR